MPENTFCNSQNAKYLDWEFLKTKPFFISKEMLIKTLNC